MAEADHKSSTYVPPRFRLLTEVVAADGLKTVRDRHASGEPAFGLSQHTGKMVEIPLELWRTHDALEVLEFGIWYRLNRSGGPYSFHSAPRTETFVVLVADKPVVGTRPDSSQVFPCEPESPPPSAKQRAGPQMLRVLSALKKLYPPDGKVPLEVSTEDLRGRVNKELEPDNRNRGLRHASWDTVDRARTRG